MTLLADISEALYGPRWQSELARALSVNIRTVQRWAIEDVQPSPGIYAELADIARERRKALADLLPKLEKAAKG